MHLRAFPLAPLLALVLLVGVGALAYAPNPPFNLPTGGCMAAAQFFAEPVIVNGTATVRVEATFNLPSHPEVWMVEWLRFSGGLLLQDVFHEPQQGPYSVYDTYFYPNVAYNYTLVEVRFWSAAGECICAGSASIPSPLSGRYPSTSNGQFDYRQFLFGAYLDANGSLTQTLELSADAGPTNSLKLKLYPAGKVVNVGGTPQSYISYLAISVNGQVPGTNLLLHQFVPASMALVSDGAWELGPASWRLVPHAGLTMTYNELRLPPGTSEADARVFRLDTASGAWVGVPDAVTDPLRNTVTANVSDMGVYAVLVTGAAVTTTATVSATSAPTGSATTTGSPVSDTTTATSTPAASACVAAAALGLALLAFLRHPPKAGKNVK